MTKRDAKAAIAAKFKRANKHTKVLSVRHLSLASYVVGYAGSQCLIVASPWMTAEPQVRDDARRFPLTIINDFDDSLRPGDWCASGYVSTRTGGWQVAIQIPVSTPLKRRKAKTA